MGPNDGLNISVFLDGDKYCAVFTDTFENLQESLAGFGDTELEAIEALFDVHDAVLGE